MAIPTVDTVSLTRCWLDYQPLFREMSQRSLPKSRRLFLGRILRARGGNGTYHEGSIITEDLLRCSSVYSSGSYSNIKAVTPSSSIKPYKFEASIGAKSY